MTSLANVAAYANESFVKDDLYMVVLVTRDEPGYSETTYLFSTESDAKNCADAINAARGLTEQTVTEIVLSSFRADD